MKRIQLSVRPVCARTCSSTAAPPSVPLRRKWAISSTGTVPASQLDVLHREFMAAQQQRHDAAVLPTVFDIPAVNNHRRGVHAGPAEAAAEGSTTPHMDVYGSYDGLLDDAPTAELTDGDASADTVREVARRARLLDYSTLHGTALAAMTPDQVQAAASAPKSSLHSRLRDKKARSTAEWANRQRNHSILRQPPQTLASATAMLFPVKRLDEYKLTSAAHASAQADVETARKEQLRQEAQEFAPSEALRANTFSGLLRKFTLDINKKYPTNHLITAQRVTIQGIYDKIGGAIHYFPPAEQEAMTVGAARELATEHEMDLIQVRLNAAPRLGMQDVAVCIIADATSFAMDEMETQFARQPGPIGTYETLEVGFTGATDGFAVKFKTREIAKFLARKHFVRVVLRHFGTPREGFPVFEVILEEIKKEAKRIKVDFAAGTIRYDKGELVMMLMPSTPKAPVHATTVPSQADIAKAMDEAIYDEQYDREVVAPGEMAHEPDRKRMEWMRHNGLAWTYRSRGLTLAQQRVLKVFQRLPKNQTKMFMARGDVNVKQFTGKSKTSNSALLWPRVSNLDQSRRGTTVLTTRHDMGLSEMIDEGETESNTSRTASLWYRGAGDALDVGSAKEQLGLKTNRHRIPRKAAGFATLGVQEASQYPSTIKET
jgi:translation initiation factor IF-3